MIRIKNLKKYISEILLGVFIIAIINPITLLSASSEQKIIFPLQEISTLECRFTKWNELGSNCKRNMPKIDTNNYQRYANKDGGYNNYTRTITVLYLSSYKYGWDIGYGGHMGVDIATSEGTPVYSIAKGKVIRAEYLNALGNTVSVEHEINGKKIVSNYSHLSYISVSKGDKIESGKKVGEVGSTGNSTGNHLHFQIDIKNNSHPYYPDYSKCPYSYYQITEDGVCMNEIQKHTIDPFKFIESNGSIVDNITIKKLEKNTNQDKNDDNYIFSRTVYKGYNKNDIKKVQEIYTKLGVYQGGITGKYEDIEESIIQYQLLTGVIKTRNEQGSGWFGPKTRAQTKLDYDKYLKNGIGFNSDEIIVKNTNKTQKISRTKLLTREEIEAREVQDFLKKYNVELKLREIGGNIPVGTTKYLDLEITDKKGRPFKGTMPGGMTFIVNNDVVNVFPKKLFYFTDGTRNIHLIGLKKGNTKLHVRIGNKQIASIPLRIFNPKDQVSVESSSIIGTKNIRLGENKSGAIVFKDKNDNKLVNLPFQGEFVIQGKGDIKICIKKGEFKNVKKIYEQKCRNEDFKKYRQFNYNDTIEGVLIFDYKAYGNNGGIEVKKYGANTALALKNIKAQVPKGLAHNYPYKNDVVRILKKGIADNENQGYFQEQKTMNEYEAFSWIRRALIGMNEKPEYYNRKPEIEQNLRTVWDKRENASKYNKISRGELLELVNTHLVFEKHTKLSNKNYIDGNADINQHASIIFDDQTTWKDDYGKNYFQADKDITRGEAAYLLTKALDKNAKTYITFR